VYITATTLNFITYVTYFLLISIAKCLEFLMAQLKKKLMHLNPKIQYV
jgi:hypothetical protein